MIVERKLSSIPSVYISTIILIYFYIHTANGHTTCNHIHPKHHEVSHTIIEPEHIMRKRSIDQPLRIFLYYDESVSRMDEEKIELLQNTVLREAVYFMQRALSVRKVENVLRLTRQCNASDVVKDSVTYCIDACRERTKCGEVEIPDDHLDVCRVCNATKQNCRTAEDSKAGPGIDGFDFVFYISHKQTTRCNRSPTLAYAAHCQQEAALDRPIAGYVNLCPNSISDNPQQLDMLLLTLKHEILHALGFSASLYAFYRDEQGYPRTPRMPDTGKPALNEDLQIHQWSDQVIKRIRRSNWMVVKSEVLDRDMDMMVTPNVVREVRDHFQCQELEGAELEDQGGEGTALTHWEKRVFESEAMTGTHTQNAVISRITLALMEDTGWYRANYSLAEPMTWGKDLGCDFVMKSCKVWMTMKTMNGAPIHPFCNKVMRSVLQTECNTDRNAVALCNLVQHDYILPEKYQNFESIRHVESGEEGYYGGSVSLADYCPYIQEVVWKSNNIVVRGSHCKYVDNNPKPDKNFALEKYDSNSKCFDHSRLWEERSCRQVREWQKWGAGCYNYKCENGRLHIEVGNYSYTCYHTSQEIFIRIINNEWLRKGVIVCPPCKEICAEELAMKGEQCKPNEQAPPASSYPGDELQCPESVVNKTVY